MILVKFVYCLFGVSLLKDGTLFLSFLKGGAPIEEKTAINLYITIIVVPRLSRNLTCPLMYAVIIYLDTG